MTLSMMGIIFSLYIIGWVPVENNFLIGASCFFMFLGCMVASTLGWLKSIAKKTPPGV
jgi:hypothetical protein